MKYRCEKCRAKYEFDQAAVEKLEKLGSKVRCPQCNHIGILNQGALQTNPAAQMPRNENRASFQNGSHRKNNGHERIDRLPLFEDSPADLNPITADPEKINTVVTQTSISPKPKFSARQVKKYSRSIGPKYPKPKKPDWNHSTNSSLGCLVENRSSRLNGNRTLQLKRFVLTTLILTSVVALCEHFDILSSFERTLKGIFAKPLYTSDESAPFVIIAVDSLFVDQHGCPPYAQAELINIETHLSKLEIRDIVLADGELVWLRRNLIDRPGPIRYMVPHSLSWDAYAKHYEVYRPIESRRTQPIDAWTYSFEDSNHIMELSPKGLSPWIHGPKLASWLAKDHSNESRTATSDELIQFLGPSGSVPTLPLSRIMRNEFKPSDLENRRTILAITHEACRKLIKVPTDARGMSAAEIHAHAAVTLFKRPLLSLSGIWNIVFYFAITVIAFFALKRIRFSMRALTTLFFLGFWVGLAIFSAAVFKLLLPLSFPLLGMLSAFLCLTASNFSILSSEIKNANQRFTSALNGSLAGKKQLNNRSSQTFHENMISFVKMFLPISHSHLFVTKGEDNRLQMVSELHTQNIFIKDRRRDLRREPWRSAVADTSGGYIDGFTNDPGTKSWGIPIFLSGRCNGFLLLGLKKSLVVTNRHRKLFKLLALEISSFLALHTNADDAAIHNGHIIDPWHKDIIDFYHIKDELLTQSERFHLFLDNLGMGVVFFNLLGEVTYSNTKANMLFQRIGLEFPTQLKNLIQQAVPVDSANPFEVIESALTQEKTPCFYRKVPDQDTMYQFQLNFMTSPISIKTNSSSGIVLTIVELTHDMRCGDVKPKRMVQARGVENIFTH